MPPTPPLLGPGPAVAGPGPAVADGPGASRAPAHPRCEHCPDDALDDVELISARAALAQGRWQSARSLLLHTGDDWDRRGHRATVLAGEPYAGAWAREWLLAEPGSAGAATLYALTLVRRALRGKEEPDRAREACAGAAALAPADPTPWLGLLLLARHLGTDEETRRVFGEVRRRHPEHHHAHHLMAARIAETEARGTYELCAFAERAAAEAPADSPLAVLPVVAYTERHRVLAATGRAPADPATAGHWAEPSALRALGAAFDWWLEWGIEEHPRRYVDLNHLAHATFGAGRYAESAALFQRIGRHATPAPWSYLDRDPCAAFRAARERTLGG
ncbi:hypothetical protein ACFY0B_21415 [Streptomyces sp. NPDC001797]|uniref:hypothetical protein n=1 Tax=Streptomyces sp. NPDC001797 TaxID=3364610 RepID=UPI00368F46AD